MSTTSTLNEKTIPELREMAEGLGIEYSDAKEAAGGKTPTKAAWISVIENHEDYSPEEQGETSETPEEPKAPKKKGKAAKKTEVKRVKWNPEETKFASQLVRAGLKAGVPDEQIKEVVREKFPDYGAIDICVPVYRRQLQEKGELPKD